MMLCNGHTEFLDTYKQFALPDSTAHLTDLHCIVTKLCWLWFELRNTNSKLPQSSQIHALSFRKCSKNS